MESSTRIFRARACDPARKPVGSYITSYEWPRVADRARARRKLTKLDRSPVPPRHCVGWSSGKLIPRKGQLTRPRSLLDMRGSMSLVRLARDHLVPSTRESATETHDSPDMVKGFEAVFRRLASRTATRRRDNC